MVNNEITKEQLLIEYQKVAAELCKIKKEFNLILNNIPAMVFKGYADWSVDFYSTRVEEMIGYSKNDFDSRQLKWTDILLEEDMERTKFPFIKALKTDRNYVREYRIKSKNGQIIWIQERSYIVCDSNGKIDYISGIFFDITEQVLNESLLQYCESLEEM
ncbi:MAG: PAS domain-containing protein [Thermodesulfobacteriota bacterium]